VQNEIVSKGRVLYESRVLDMAIQELR